MDLRDTPAGYSGDGGLATIAGLSGPAALKLDSVGNLYIADINNHAVRKMDLSTGIISTYAGTGVSNYTGDGGPSNQATLGYPAQLALDSSNNLFISDANYSVIREVNFVTGIISTFAGTGVCGYTGDNGNITGAQICPWGIAINSGGDLYFSDPNDFVIRKISFGTNIITTIAGNSNNGDTGDGGLAVDAQLGNAEGIDLDSSGNIYFADEEFNVVRKINTTTGIISSVAGNSGSGPGYSGDGGAAVNAEFNLPVDVAVDTNGDVYIADAQNGVIRRVSNATGNISTSAGLVTFGYAGNGILATQSILNTPLSVALDTGGNLFISDQANWLVREVNAASGIISNVAGSGIQGDFGEGVSATSAQISFGQGVAVDANENFYLADQNLNTVRKVSAATGEITTVAGTLETIGYSGDQGPATAAKLRNPFGITVDKSGNLYISDVGNNVIRMVTFSTGIISTVAGTGVGGFSGDNGPATSAKLNGCFNTALDGAGNIYIADMQNSVVRKVTVSTGIITTVAGNHSVGYSGDLGPATLAALRYPQGIALDTYGNLYIADTGNNVIRKVILATGIISTVAGNGTRGYSGDGGIPLLAAFNQPIGIAVDIHGNIYVADETNNLIREIIP
jgi:sugar lactone lactonase YvrE